MNISDMSFVEFIVRACGLVILVFMGITAVQIFVAKVMRP